jgi:hypothetical protein
MVVIAAPLALSTMTVDMERKPSLFPSCEGRGVVFAISIWLNASDRKRM